jgi:hypothetical protein
MREVGARWLRAGMQFNRCRAVRYCPTVVRICPRVLISGGHLTKFALRPDFLSRRPAAAQSQRHLLAACAAAPTIATGPSSR